MDLVLKFPNQTKNNYNYLLIDVKVKPNILKGELIFKSAETRKDNALLKTCNNNNNLKFITAAVTREGFVSSNTRKLLEFIAKHGSKTLNRNNIQASYF